MRDPSRSEMLAYLERLPYADEFDEFDREAAVYWFAYAYHGGQGSDLYAALCASPYCPSIIATGVDEESGEGLLYHDLEHEFAV